MNETSNGNGMGDWPGPVQFVAGFCIWAMGLVLAFPGALLRAFPVTAPLGSPIMKAASGVCYNGGFHMGQGLMRSVRGLGSLIGAGVRSARKSATPANQSGSLPPAE